MTQLDRIVQQAQHIQQLQRQIRPSIAIHEQDPELVKHLAAATTTLLDLIEAAPAETWTMLERLRKSAARRAPDAN